MTKEIPLLIFKPTKKALFKKSPIYALSMFAKSSISCLGFLIKALLNPDKSIGIADYYINQFWKTHFQESTTSLYVTGLKYIETNKTYIYMSNHSSWMDIPAIFGAVPTSVRMISKAGLMQVPFLGPAMARAGFIAIDRQNRSVAIKQLELAKKRLKAGISIWMAPEGTRSRDGTIKAFKKGGFHVARELGLKIVPVFIEGAYEVMPPDSIMVQTNKAITVHFCKPIDAALYAKENTNDLIKLVRDSMIAKQQQYARTI
jgi:1-acyl-sn-glycerol-3-phosphate acyltransferase